MHCDTSIFQSDWWVFCIFFGRLYHCVCIFNSYLLVVLRFRKCWVFDKTQCVDTAISLCILFDIVIFCFSGIRFRMGIKRFLYGVYDDIKYSMFVNISASVTKNNTVRSARSILGTIFRAQIRSCTMSPFCHTNGFAAIISEKM